VSDSDFTADYVTSNLVPLISNNRQLTQMAAAAKRVGVPDGTARLLKMVLGVLKVNA
jgi:UDP-N-acetylglucosamine--N-acetylmuramyl-(pentapeptide) pyrophosphoryl-undecaprenol N-acetylglucosamine transferase